LHTLDALAQSGTLAIVTSTRVPWRLPQLMPGLSSRLSSCLGIPLAWPGPEARRSILERLALARETMLGADVVEYLADALEGSFLELRGALLELEVAAKNAKRPIDLAFAREHLAGRQSQEGVGLATITSAVAKCFRVKSADLKGPSRQKGLVLARQIGMYLSRQLTGHSLQAIGEHFGGRDHTTVLHACSKTESLLNDDPGTRQTVHQLFRQLTGRGAE
jgi:chromosomal replication initiator protein